VNIKSLLSGKERILILGHHNADPDAICSMYAFSEIFKVINEKGTFVMACDDVSRLSKQVIKTFIPEASFSNETDGDFDFVVVLDSNSKLQLGSQFADYLQDPSKVLVIDHHAPNPAINELSDHVIVGDDRSSTCELMFYIFENLEIIPSKVVSQLLFTGLLFDTRRFLYGNIDTLKVAIRLIELGADFDASVNSLMIVPDRSEKIARLKSAGRLRIHDIDGWIVVTSKAGAFEASVCRGLIDLGADVSIVGGKPSEKVVRLSSRSTRRFYAETGVNLGCDVMEPLGELIDGKGGGHPNAAGANGVRNRDEAITHAVELIRAAIKNKTSEQEGVDR
jgi:phosphoesterase RecJ-like protein